MQIASLAVALARTDLRAVFGFGKLSTSILENTLDNSDDRVVSISSSSLKLRGLLWYCVSTIRSQQSARAISIVAASLSLVVAKTIVRRPAVCHDGISVVSVSANAVADAGLCAISRITSGEVDTISARPANVASASPLRIESGLI